ncbi:MAG: YjbF family lipoprotein [Gemmobacter sp.]
MRRTAFMMAAVLLTVTLAGCGSDADETAGARALQAVAQSAVSRRAAPQPGAFATPPGLTRALLATLGAPVELITIEATGATGLVEKVGQNRGVETWVSADDKTVSWRDGIILATRGFGPDLMAAEAPTAAQVAAGGSWERVHVGLDGLDQTVRARYQCRAVRAGVARIVIVERAHDTIQMRESCVGMGTRFENEYWFDRGSVLRASRQWINPTLGHLAIRRLSN